MQVVCETELGCGNLHRLQVEAGTGIDVEPWRQPYVAAGLERLGDVVLGGEHSVFHPERTVQAERVAQVHRPGDVWIGVIEPSTRDEFAGYRMVEVSLIVACRTVDDRPALAAAVVGVLCSVVTFYGSVAGYGVGCRCGNVVEAQEALAACYGEFVDPGSCGADGIRVEAGAAANGYFVEQRKLFF